MEKNLSGAGLLPPMRPGQARSIVTATREQHKRMRKTLSHAFSDKALKEQEWFLLSYVDQLVDRLREMSTAGPVDLVKWLVCSRPH
jgi:cytochrome P450